MFLNISEPHDFKVGAYIRLSKEDGDKQESESVTNQRNLILRYIIENHLELIDEYIDDKKLEKLGYTRETFKGSNTEALLESMLFATEKTIQEETKRLMKEHSLSYGEARITATNVVLNSIENGLKEEVLNNEWWGYFWCCTKMW